MRKTILVVDDAEFNRFMLKDALKDEYEIVEAANGKEALEIIDKKEDDLAAVLLDLIMPEMSGEEVLAQLNKKKKNIQYPILVITAEQSLDAVEKCFDYGISDFIRKPFKPSLVKKRVKKLVELYSQKNDYRERLDRQTMTLRNQYRLLQSQAEQLKQNNENILAAVGTIAEYRNMESSHHIENIKQFTRIILKYAMKEYPEYGLTEDSIRVIVSASALHDIGKIVIPDRVLLKPGKLTPEEFELMCSHPLRGYEIIDSIVGAWDEEYGRYSKEIARSHHERYDGRGYPEGLKGEEIPLSAQIVGIVDCFDALLTDKVYKEAYAFEEAVPMILDGECGVFSPKLMECFRLAKDELYSYYMEVKKNKEAESQY